LDDAARTRSDDASRRSRRRRQTRGGQYLWRKSIQTCVSGDHPATQRAYAKAKEVNTQPTVSEQAKTLHFGQTAAVVEQD
jgi:hypothetical protein